MSDHSFFNQEIQMKKKYYATPEMVKAYLKQLGKKGKELPEFPTALKMMQEQDLLSETPMKKPHIDGIMSREAFMTAFDQIPFEVNRVIGTLEQEHENNRRIALQDTVDIACAQHIHTHGFTNQTLYNVFAFTYVLQGICTVAQNQSQIKLKQGDIFIASPGFEHAIHTTPDTFALVVVVRVAAFEILFHDFLTSDLLLSDYFKQYISDKMPGNYCIIHGNPEDDELRFYIQSLACEYMDINKYYSNTCAVSLLKLFLARAFRKYHNRTSFYHQDFSSEYLNENAIYQYIQLNYRDITLEKIAQHFHFNRTYVSRYIHAHFDKTFMEIVTQTRISYAKEYLRKTDKRITEIAEITGYNSLNHFTKAFHKFTGYTPGEYRKQNIDL